MTIRCPACLCRFDVAHWERGRIVTCPNDKCRQTVRTPGLTTSLPALPDEEDDRPVRIDWGTGTFGWWLIFLFVFLPLVAVLLLMASIWLSNVFDL